MVSLLIEYGRLSTDQQTNCPTRLPPSLGVDINGLYADQPLTITARRARPGQVVAVFRGGDALVVTKLDRLARSRTHASAIDNELTARRFVSTWAGRYTNPPALSTARSCCHDATTRRLRMSGMPAPTRPDQGLVPSRHR